MEDVPRALKQFVDYLEYQVLKYKIQAVYVAVPLTEEAIRDGMKKMVKERLGPDFPVWSSEDLFPFVYSLSCEKFSEHDIISTSEQEICVRSNAFLSGIINCKKSALFYLIVIQKRQKHNPSVARDTVVLVKERVRRTVG